MMTSVSAQIRDPEWFHQWANFQDDVRFLFDEYIAPRTLDDLRNKSVLECGCGGGQHTALVASVAHDVTAVDLNTAEIAKARNRGLTNVEFVRADIAEMQLGRQFDVVFCVGVIHHTDDPDRTFDAIYRHCRTGGLVVIWTYSSEGNALVRYIVEPVRKLWLRHLTRRTVSRISQVVTAMMYPFVYSIYVPSFTSFLPYHEYFRNFRRLDFRRNVLNVFDKLNAPQTHFTTRATCERWFSPDRFESGSVTIRPYAGVSYTLTGIKR